VDELPEPSPGQAREVLDRLVIVKLNGGLGTSMGLSGPKSLLEVKPGTSFLDVLATQVLALREQQGARVPVVLMNSATTRGPSLDVLRRYDGLGVPSVPLDFLRPTSVNEVSPSVPGPSSRWTRTFTSCCPTSSNGFLPGRRRCAAAAGSRSKATSPSAPASWPWATCVWPVRVTFRTGRCSAAETGTVDRIPVTKLLVTGGAGYVGSLATAVLGQVVAC
jgi:UTP--glucose-1-phosphate uridylyltransferase